MQLVEIAGLLVLGAEIGGIVSERRHAKRRSNECAECERQRELLCARCKRGQGVALDDVLMAMGAEGFDGRERRLAIEVDRDLGIEPTYRDYARPRPRKATEAERMMAAGRVQG